MKCRRSQPRQRLGFSLIELVIVIGIVVLLLAILLPSLGTARELARSVQCLNNLRSIGQAAAAYATQNAGILVHGYAGTQSSGSSGHKADAENYATTLVNAKMIEAPPTPAMGAGLVSNQQSIFRCPSGSEEIMPLTFGVGDAGPAFNGRRVATLGRGMRTRSDKTGVIIDNWYGWNATINDFNNIKAPYRRIPGSTNGDGMRLNRMSDLRYPDRTVFLYDGIFLNPHFEADRIHARHNRNRITNVLFADGHAVAYSTEALPGGFGPNAEGTDLFTTAALRAAGKTDLIWRTDQQ